MRLALVILIAVLAGCAHNKDDPMKSIDEVAAQARRDIDALAARVGTNPDVRQDVITDCVPGRKDSGKDLIYTVHVKVEPGALKRLEGEIADELRDDGWTVKAGPGAEEARFAKGNATMGAAVREDLGMADVGGSGGCVK